MAYTRAWDELFPPDTQYANLLGDDIRKFKTDIRERIVSFAAGPLVDRPTPESSWGSANDGVVYYATDQGILYRWNGSSWITLTGFNPRIASSTPSVTIPANTLVPGSAVLIALSGGGPLTITFMIGSSVIASYSGNMNVWGIAWVLGAVLTNFVGVVGQQAGVPSVIFNTAAASISSPIVIQLSGASAGTGLVVVM